MRPNSKFRIPEPFRDLILFEGFPGGLEFSRSDRLGGGINNNLGGVSERSYAHSVDDDCK
jgi:hypothetical protein